MSKFVDIWAFQLVYENEWFVENEGHSRTVICSYSVADHSTTAALLEGLSNHANQINLLQQFNVRCNRLAKLEVRCVVLANHGWREPNRGPIWSELSADEIPFDLPLLFLFVFYFCCMAIMEMFFYNSFSIAQLSRILDRLRFQCVPHHMFCSIWYLSVN